MAGSIHFHSGQKSQAIGPTFFLFVDGLIFRWVKLLRVFNVFSFLGCKCCGCYRYRLNEIEEMKDLIIVSYY